MDITGEPEGENDFEAFGTGEIGSEPDFFKGFEDEVSLINGRSSLFFKFGFSEPSKLSEQTDPMFSVISTGRTEFIEDKGSFLTRCFFVP